MNRLFALNNLRWYWRLPIKWTVFGLTVLIVCFPYPSRFVSHVRHWSDPNALIEPDAPAIQPFVDELRPMLADDPPPREALKRVERYVLEKIPYAWDWVTWGTADYLPTVTEAVEMGREDCDGRAVVAASVLQSLGFNAQIVTDLSHVWVKTDQGELMGPGKKKAIVATEKGLRVRLSALTELPKALAYGSAVFPLIRELVILVVLWVLLLRSEHEFSVRASGLVCLLTGLFILRAGGQDYRAPVPFLQWTGLVMLLGGVGWLLFLRKRRTREPANE